MKTQTAVFQDHTDPISKFRNLLGQLANSCPIKMSTRSERTALRKEIKRRVPSDKGIYVLNEDDNALYVGRTDQMADRVLGHGQKPGSHKQSKATFALILAKEHFKKLHPTQHDLFSKELARKLNENPSQKIELWQEAVERVKKMQVRVVEVEHPHQQAVFEVYVHEKLKTPYNSFANH